MQEGIAIGRSFAIATNEQIDGNKEMVAYGLINIVGSMTSCYLITGSFSETAVNVNARCKTLMSNVVQAVCMMMVLLFLSPLFSYTPQVALSTIIISAMLGLIKYKKLYYLFKTDKLDFVICMSAFFGVSFINMDMGLMISVGLALVRALLYMTRPATCKLGNIPNSKLYHDVEQYPGAIVILGFLVLQIGSLIYFANANYMKERILRWVRDGNDLAMASDYNVEFVLLNFGG
ncbi:UNVERIFIED_CONTAM: putative sulfate transporter 3.5 [Sesamum radiatum]|uniref:Sulfate transporter 3.5 n=1 Tax=Sesamum radiatum TaxID=300843 RepID=A0AAW2NR14_SESRA